MIFSGHENTAIILQPFAAGIFEYLKYRADKKQEMKYVHHNKAFR